MDSLTQAALGASIGQLVLGNKIGRKAALAGGLVATLPDLDVLVPFTDAVANFTYHRSASHSFIVLTLMTPVLYWMLNLARGGKLEHRKEWLWMIFLALNTHVLLDCFTIYGTQAFWPLSNYPIGWATIFIIDPLYTVPLISGLAIALFTRFKALTKKRALIGALTFSSAYLTLGVVLHERTERKALQALRTQGITHNALVTAPTPLSLMWRIVARDDDNYYIGFRSIFDQAEDISFKRRDAGEELVKAVATHWPVQRLQWFTKGLYASRMEGQSLVMSDLRMGIESQYLFSFEVATRNADSAEDPLFTPIVARQLPFNPDVSRMRQMVKRVTDETVTFD